jgi:hypothetical protein
LQVAGGGLDVGVPDPSLDLDERGLVDGHGAEEVAQRVKRQGAKAGAADGLDDTAAQRAWVEVAVQG